MQFGIGILIKTSMSYGGVYKLQIFSRKKRKEFFQNFLEISRKILEISRKFLEISTKFLRKSVRPSVPSQGVRPSRPWGHVIGGGTQVADFYKGKIQLIVPNVSKHFRPNSQNTCFGCVQAEDFWKILEEKKTLYFSLVKICNLCTPRMFHEKSGNSHDSRG